MGHLIPWLTFMNRNFQSSEYEFTPNASFEKKKQKKTRDFCFRNLDICARSATIVYNREHNNLAGIYVGLRMTDAWDCCQFARHNTHTWMSDAVSQYLGGGMIRAFVV
jgi:hypothetical protein